MREGQRKILHLIDSSGFYGAECVVLNLCAELRKMGIKAVLGCFAYSRHTKPQLAALAESQDVPVIYVPGDGKLSIKALKSLNEICRKKNISLLHSHGYKASFYCLLLNRIFKVRFVTTCHSWTNEGGKLRLYNYLGKVSMLAAERVIAVSDSVARDIGSWKGIQSKLRIIRNGIDLRNYPVSGSTKHQAKLKEELGLNQEFRLVGTLGRLIHLKAHDVLIEAAHLICRDFKGVEFLVAGGGPLMSHLRIHVEKRGLNHNFHFLGFRNDPINILKLLDVFVLPSRIEGLPVALLEAMAVGKPCVATAVGGIPSIIENGINGLLVPPDDVDSLASAIADLLSDKNLAGRIGKQARATINRKFSSERMAKKYSELYEKFTTNG